MPTYQLLTDRVLANPTAITPTTLIHIVTTDDVSQNPAGSSYKAELGQLSNLFSGSTFTGNTSATCINELYVSDVYGCSGTTFHDNVCFETIATGTTGYTLSVTEGGCLIIATGTTSEKVVTKDLEVTNTLLGPRGSFTDYMKASRLKSFSPLFINDEDEGNVYFGSSSGVTIDVVNNRIGINDWYGVFGDPNAKLDIYSTGDTITAGIFNDTTVSGTTYGLTVNSENNYGLGGSNVVFWAQTTAGITNDSNIAIKGTVAGGPNDYAIQLLDGQEVVGKVLTCVLPTGEARWENPTNIFTSGLTGDTLVVSTSYTPSGSTDTNGVPGSISWDNTYIYLKNNTGWVRVSGETW
jgi:hypothetical protein